MPKEKVLDPVKERNKLLATAAKKTVAANTAIPILEDIYFSGTEAIMTDLETTVVVPFPASDGKGVCVPARKVLDVMEIMDISGMNVDANFGVVFSGPKRSIKIMGENPNQFPKSAMITDYKQYIRGGQPYQEIGKLSAADMELLKAAICFVSNDDLRPTMTGVRFESPDVNKQSWMVATDAHRLFFKPISTMSEDFIIPQKAVKILLALGGEWILTSDSYLEHKDGKIVIKQPTKKEIQPLSTFTEGGIKYCGGRENEYKRWCKYYDYVETFEEFLKGWGKIFNPDNEDCFEQVEVPDLDQKPRPVKVGPLHICFTRADGVKVVTTVIEGKFPDWRVVVPDFEKDYTATLVSDKEFLLRELKNAGKFANRSTNQVTFTLNGCVKVHSQEVDFGEEYEYEFTPGEAQAEFNPDKLGDCVQIAFNGKFISEMIQKQPDDQPVIIKVITSTKGALINDGYMIMPLMINQ